MNSAPSTHQMAVGRADVDRLFPPEGEHRIWQQNYLLTGAKSRAA